MVHPDQSIIEGLVNNQRDTIELVYRKYLGKIVTYVKRNNGDEDEAKDLFQEALVSIYKRAKDNTFELRCPFEAYLLLVCKSKWINVLNSARKKKETKTEEIGYIDEKEEAQLTDIMNYEAKIRLIHDKLAQLSSVCIEIIKLSWNGISMQEIAIKHNFSYAYARKKKSECIAKLIETVKGDPTYSQLILDVL